MRKLRQAGAVAVALLMVAASAPVLTASDSVTVGDFVQRVAEAKGVDSTDAYASVSSLAGVGVRVPADLEFSSPLTEGDVVAIARSLGINVRSGNPDASFTADQVDRFFLSFDSDITAGQSSTPDFDLYDDLVDIDPGLGDENVSGDWFFWWKGWFPGYWWAKWLGEWIGKWKGKWKGKGKGGKKGGGKTKKDPH